MKISELMNHYADTRVIKPITEDHYRGIATWFIRDIGDMCISDVGRAEAARFRKSTLMRIQPVTWVAYRAVLLALFNHAVKWELLQRNPFLDMDPTPVPRARPKSLQPDTIRRVLDALDQITDDRMFKPTWFWKTLIETLLYTGVRRRQLVELQWRDIDFDMEIITIRPETNKSLKGYVVPIHPQLLLPLQYLASTSMKIWVQFNRPNVYPTSQVFNLKLVRDKLACNASLTPTNVSRTMHRISLHCGVHITPHRFRHTYGRTLMQQTRDIRVVQEALGHRSVHSTLIYVTPDMDALRNAVRAISFDLDT